MKPYVICHMCTTIDGRILVDRHDPPPEGSTGREQCMDRMSSA
jgi:hypothetical protein